MLKHKKKRSIKRTITKLDTKIKSNQILVDEIEKKSKLKKIKSKTNSNQKNDGQNC
jgi:hypothetical protein